MKEQERIKNSIHGQERAKNEQESARDSKRKQERATSREMHYVLARDRKGKKDKEHDIV